MDQRSKLKAVIQEEVKQELKEIFGLFGKGSTEKFTQDSEGEPPPVEKFSLLTLKQLGSSKEIRDYVRRTLPFLKKGQARAAYAIDDTRIIKIALSDNKTYQNKNEVENSRCLGPKVAVQVLSFHPKYVWIIEERLKPITSSAEITAKFNQLSNLDGQELMFIDAIDIKNFLADMSSLLRGRSDFAEYQKRHNLLMSTSPWYQELVNKLRGCQVASWDFHKDNWGIRPSTGELVLLDIGFGRTESDSQTLAEFFTWVLNETPTPFSLDALRSQSSIGDVENYLTSSLGPHKFSGAYRRVWILDSDKIIKVVYHENNAVQNEKEVANATCLGTDYAPKILDYDKKRFFWVVEERLTPISGSGLFDKLKGLLDHRFANWQELVKFIAFSVTKKDRYNDPQLLSQATSLYNLLYAQNKWFKGLIDGLRGCEVGSDDFHDDNWGIRPSTGELVLLDLGF